MNEANSMTLESSENAAEQDIHAIFAQVPKNGTMAEMVGWSCIGFDQGQLRLGFKPQPFFCNPMGMIHGGFVASMLDETMGSTIFATTQGKSIGATISAAIDYIRPAMLGALEGRGRIRHFGKSIVFVEAELFSADEKLLAKSSAAFKLVELGLMLNSKMTASQKAAPIYDAPNKQRRPVRIVD